MPRPRYQTENVVLKPRLVEGAVSSYNFLNPLLKKFIGNDRSTMVVYGLEMAGSLAYVGEISLEFCNLKFKDKVFDTLKNRGVIDVRVDPDKINFEQIARSCKNHLMRNDKMFQRYEVKNMASTSFAYGAYGGMLS